MITNYLTVALRNLARHPGYALINILGLSVGLAAVALIGLFVRHEFSFDRSHPDGDNIY
jgi:putative ABC transport system permease protein